MRLINCEPQSQPEEKRTSPTSCVGRLRIGFLFNHDQVHQIAHSLPIAIALARRNPRLKVIIAYTSERLSQEIIRLASPYDLAGMDMVQLPLRSRLARASARILDSFVPMAKLAVYRDNLSFFASLDVLVVAEKTSALLRTRYGLDHLRLVHTRHGAGDRAVGFNRASALFDFVLVSGPKIRDRLVQQTGVDPSRIATVGYPKFDIVRPSTKLKFSGNGRKTVLYNPHCSPHLSSWYDHGRAVLDYFAASTDYNLIFAPHVMLFERPVMVSIDRLRLNFPGTIAERYRDAPNIHVDLGSSASTDMSYTDVADLYLGDVSSQVYEFLRRPRPCLFINPAGYRSRLDANFYHQRAGPVISTARDLDAGLEAAFAGHRAYAPIQRKMFAQSIALDATPSSDRAANAIERFVGLGAECAKPSGRRSLGRSSKMMGTAVILAGSRPGKDPLATVFGMELKALVPIAGKPMVRWPVEVLLACNQFSEVRVLAQQPERIRDALPTHPKLRVATSASSIAETLERLCFDLSVQWPIFITTADHALLDQRMIQEFCEHARPADIAIGVVERCNLMAQLPQSRRTWIRFRSGAYSGTNMFLLGGKEILPALKVWRSVEQDRKKGWKILWAFGVHNLLAAALRFHTIHQTLDRIGSTLGLRIKAVDLSDPLAAVDVDKLSDHECVEALLEARACSLRRPCASERAETVL